MLASLLTVAALLSPAARVDARDPGSDALPRATFIYFGRNRAHEVLAGEVGRSIRSLTPVAEGPRVAAREGRVLFRPGGGLTVAQLRAFLSAGPHRRERLIEPFPVLAGPFEVVFEHPARDPAPVLDLIASRLPGVRPVSARLVRFVNALGDEVRAVELPDADLDAPLETDPYAWELRFAYEGKVELDGVPRPLRFFNVGRPLNDGARRFEVLRQLREAHPDAILLGAGEDIEHYSFVETGKPDGQRPHTWRAWRRLKLDALAPGAAETAFGVDALQREAQENGVPVLAANVPDGPFAGWRLVERGDLRILLVGIADPKLDGLARRRGFGRREIAPPAPHVCDAVRKATEHLGRRPDLVVAFGVLRGPERDTLARDCPELDVLITDFADHGFAPESAEVAVANGEFRERRRDPVTIVQAGRLRLGVVEISLREGRPVTARSRAFPVTTETAPDRDLAYAVQRTRQDAYASAQTFLLPDLGIVEAPEWRRMVANTLREHLEVEVAVLPRTPFPWTLTGPVTHLEAVANLNIPDEALVVSLTADQLRQLSAAPTLSALTTSGLALGPKVLGRDLDPRERYSVLTTDTLRESPELAAALDGPVVSRPGVLRDLAVDALEERRRRVRPGFEALMQPQGLERLDRWVLDVRDLQLGVSSYETFGPDPGSQPFRETRANTRAHLLLSGSGAIALRRDSTSVDWVNELGGLFNQSRFDGGEEIQETADSVRLASELQVHACSVLSAVPYTSATFETEITPTEDEAGHDNPRKQRLEGALGLLWPGEVLKQVRLAGVVGHDFASDVADPQAGLLGLLQLRQPVGFVTWLLDLEGRYYIPDLGEVDESELGVLGKGRTGLDVPVFGGLALGVFIDVFAYRGAHPDHRKWGASMLSGFALKMDRLFKPQYE